MAADPSFSDRIRTLRRERRLQQKELAIAARCSESYISRIEKGQMVPSEAVVLRLAEALGSDARALVLLARREKVPDQAKPIFADLGFRAANDPAEGADFRPVRLLPVFRAYELLAWARERGRVPPKPTEVGSGVVTGTNGHGTNGQHSSHQANGSGSPVVSVIPPRRLPGESTDADAFWLVAEPPSLCGGRIVPNDLLLVEPNAQLEERNVVLVKEPRGLTLRRVFKGGQVYTALAEGEPPLVVVGRDSEPVALKVSLVLSRP
jgi:transcriptional regulator with XRE-family HTH domain